MDHLNLLKKYIRLVIACDGITFVENLRQLGSRGYDPKNWTEVEIAALERLEHEAERACIEQSSPRYLLTGKHDA